MNMASIVAAVQVGHQLLGEDAATLQLPHLLLLQQKGSHQADNRGIVGEDPEDTVRNARAPSLAWATSEAAAGNFSVSIVIT
jgi:hypothetical protein